MIRHFYHLLSLHISVPCGDSICWIAREDSLCLPSPGSCIAALGSGAGLCLPASAAALGHWRMLQPEASCHQRKKLVLGLTP